MLHKEMDDVGHFYVQRKETKFIPIAFKIFIFLDQLALNKKTHLDLKLTRWFIVNISYGLWITIHNYAGN
jgi:hypothetical protein